MSAFLIANMAPLMFGALVVFLLIGYPVAFSLAALGISFGFFAIYLGFFDLNFLQAIPVRVFGNVLANELLLAIPFFTFMGAILERCGLAEDMLDSMGQLFGPIRGGLGYSVILVGFILGAITGTVMRRAVRSVLAPATRDASSKEAFMLRKAGVRRMTFTVRDPVMMWTQTIPQNE